MSLLGVTRLISDLLCIYADDILIVSRGCYNLQRLFDIVQEELFYIDLELNPSKCVSMRIGPRADKPCAPSMTRDGAVVKIVDKLKYLGLFSLVP
jgi:Reverse transcriptase (RNA-dependent DNA polymerase)